MRTYLVWKEGPWDLPAPKVRTVPVADQQIVEAKAAPLVGTDLIVNKNLFDPERGEGRNREAETNSRAFQRVRGMVLLGTAILGANRYAILSDPGVSAVPGQIAPPQGSNIMRLKLGDDVEGFRLSEIGEKRVVFTKGASNVEVLLDYFRKAEPPPQRATIPGQGGIPAPTLTPRIPPQVSSGAPQPRVAPVPAPGQAPVAPRVLPNLPRRERLPAPPNP